MTGKRKLVVALSIYLPMLLVTSVALLTGRMPSGEFTQLHMVVAPVVLGLFALGNSYERKLEKLP